MSKMECSVLEAWTSKHKPLDMPYEICLGIAVSTMEKYYGMWTTVTVGGWYVGPPLLCWWAEAGTINSNIFVALIC